jgi:hypothetical protein
MIRVNKKSGEHEQGDKRADDERKSGVDPEQSEIVIHIRCGGEQDVMIGAEGGTRTPTILLPPAPQAGASANSATSASGLARTIEDR